jgi:hypothetical protein
MHLGHRTFAHLTQDGFSPNGVLTIVEQASHGRILHPVMEPAKTEYDMTPQETAVSYGELMRVLQICHFASWLEHVLVSGGLGYSDYILW